MTTRSLVVPVYRNAENIPHLVQGILGLYIWRTAENTKRRPLRIISHIVSGGGGS